MSDKYSINVKDITISSAGDGVFVRLEFECGGSFLFWKNISGWVYFRGTPHFDDKANILRIDNFDYDIGTKNLIINSADWLLHKKFLNELQSKLVFDLTNKIMPIKNKILAGVKDLKLADEVNFNASFNDFNISDIYYSKDAISIFAVSNGNASININKK